MFPLCHPVSSFFSPFLCLRRGVSAFGRLHRLIVNFSLPTQRCFQLAGRVGSLGVLFSAYAEVFPFYSQSKRAPPPFLCLRRGVSQARIQRQLTPQLFSAYAEVFLMRRKAQRLNGSFLCLRRGVSDTRERRGLHLIFSLPTQRCFSRV